ncbi:hypothetical protein [Streptomyces sp. CB03238]|uniref:hypothetical protein n=1 Tax=Streptomyces sp. CB03238 TaxID=1907777 RepID=UPI000A11503A|nr:hypothetical protein [Streptomyces sp. CB03238]ORT56379.1 hypothetical protein BKD26_28265 [Streptomyces sp. CB03238]
MRATALAALLVPVALTLPGCSVPQEEIRSVSAAAAAFTAREQAADRAAACELLAPETREELAEDPGPTCAAGLAEAGLPNPGDRRTTQVYGRQARVELDQDTYFLTSFADGWKINAAGCTPRHRKPYRCLVKGD